MDKHELAVHRGDEAERILNSEIFDKAFTDVRAAYVKTWAELPTSDTESARDLHRSLKCLERVRMALEEHVKTGKLVKKSLSMKERMTNVAQKSINAFARTNRNQL